MIKSNNANEKLAFNYWIGNVDGQKRKGLKKKQIMMTEETQMTIDNSGSTDDVVFK